MFLSVERHDETFAARADLRYTIDVTGGDDFPITLAFASDWWFDPDAKEPRRLPMKRGLISLGAVEAQALAVAILLVASDQQSGPEWPKQMLAFDLTGPNYHLVAGQLPPRYFSAISEARQAVRKVMDSE